MRPRLPHSAAAIIAVVFVMHAAADAARASVAAEHDPATAAGRYYTALLQYKLTELTHHNIALPLYRRRHHRHQQHLHHHMSPIVVGPQHLGSE